MGQKKQKSQMVRLDQIVNRFDVRIHLDDDTVYHLADLYKSKVKLPPVALTLVGNNNGSVAYAYIDGRHRGAARALLGLEDVEAVIESGGRDTEALYAEALRANVGGSKPPTRADIAHTVRRMLEAGANESKITRLLSFLPKGIIHNYVSSAKAHIQRDQMREALDRVAAGTPIEQAAQSTKVDQSTLRDAIAGKKRNWRSENADIVGGTKRYITTSLRAANSAIGNRIKQLLQMIDDDDLDPKAVKDVLDAWATNVHGTAHRIQDWRHRLGQRMEN